MRVRSGSGLIAALLSVLAVLFVPAAASAVVPVTIQSDEQDGECGADCSLRDAVLIASSTGDVVQVPAGTYTLSLGELNVANVTIQGAGAGATVIQAGVNVRALLITGSATIGGVTITGGNPDGPNSGGGIEVGVGQALTLRLNDSAIAGNAVVQNSQGYGGGIMVNNQATLLMTNTTVSGNRVLGGDGPGAGAGIYVTTGGRAELRNSTVSGNTAHEDSSSGLGGGIGLDDASTLVLESVTVASNSAESGGGIAEDLDFFSPIAPTIAISDTIVAGNAGNECDGALVHSGDHNLSDDATCAFTATGDKANTNPVIGPLQVNTGVGRTATHALPLGSPAINAADPATCKPTDQRGVASSQRAHATSAPSSTSAHAHRHHDRDQPRRGRGPAGGLQRARDLGRRRRRRQPAAGQLERHDLHAGARHVRRLRRRSQPLHAHASAGRARRTARSR